MDKENRSFLLRLVRGADKTVNVIALILLMILLLYGGYNIWHVHSLQAGSFLSDDMAKYRPDGEKPTLKDLAKINPDVISWITIDATNINYPVVQGEDDTEYLNKDVMGDFSLAGSVFLTAQNKKDFSDSYNVLYGHHIEGGAMFADVLKFRQASFFKKHKTGTLWHPEGKPDAADRVEIFAVVEVGANDSRIYCDPSTIKPGELPGLVRYIRQMATQDRKLSIDGRSRIIALSTCENATSFERVILFGKLRPMTDEEIKAAMAREKDGASSQRGSIWSLIDKMPPWLLKAAGALLIILLAYILWRRYKRRREQTEERKERRTE